MARTLEHSLVSDDVSCRRLAHGWLVRDALPFWSTTGAYSNGCFVERLDLSGRPVDPGFIRVRMQARQVYVFAHAQFAGLCSAPKLLPAAADFLVRSAWLGPADGWATLVDKDGRLIDGSADLYDISFALFALAWCYRVDANHRYLDIAHATLDYLDRAMAHPSGGFFNDAKRSLPRLQNPHMHLTEALNAWFEASGDQRFIEASGALIELFTRRLYDPATGALGEYFEDDWRPRRGAEGQIVEPGHQFEWAWIIGKYGALSGSPRYDVMRCLLAFAFRRGFDEETGLTIDQVGRDGRVLRGSHRLWPQTEALKACVASEAFLGESMTSRRIKICQRLFASFLQGPVPGTWIDHFAADGSVLTDKVPATSLYHVTLAFLELLAL